MEFDLVIFDCDGVLIDSEMLSVRVDIECLAEQGVDVSAEEILERYTGISMAGMLVDLEDRCGRVLRDDGREPTWIETAGSRVCGSAPSIVPPNASSG
jgi:beta-phosphoglucomutase-like phosphatase (HAD superfamily)